MQLVDLGIKSLVDITYIIDLDKKTGAKVNEELVKEKVEKINKKLENPDQVVEKYGVRLEEVVLFKSKLVDWETIVKFIGGLPKPCMIYCSNFSAAPVVMIAYLMWRCKLDCQMASLKVMGRLGTSSVNTDLYSEVLHYQVGQEFKYV